MFGRKYEPGLFLFFLGGLVVMLAEHREKLSAQTGLSEDALSSVGNCGAFVAIVGVFFLFNALVKSKP